MVHYKTPDNRLYTLDSAAFEHLLPPGCVQITKAEADILARPDPNVVRRGQIAAELARIDVDSQRPGRAVALAVAAGTAAPAFDLQKLQTLETQAAALRAEAAAL